MLGTDAGYHFSIIRVVHTGYGVDFFVTSFGKATMMPE